MAEPRNSNSGPGLYLIVGAMAAAVVVLGVFVFNGGHVGPAPWGRYDVTIQPGHGTASAPGTPHAGQ
ncbi:MAG TPA: hypothetical protein VFC38_00775 [Stellaceae bacterium]|nr:hypothetical protein [Stellaceae bacterium]